MFQLYYVALEFCQPDVNLVLVLIVWERTLWPSSVSRHSLYPGMMWCHRLPVSCFSSQEQLGGVLFHANGPVSKTWNVFVCLFVGLLTSTWSRTRPHQGSLLFLVLLPYVRTTGCCCAVPIVWAESVFHCMQCLQLFSDCCWRMEFFFLFFF